tara:strand:- start:1853 stop:2944 length:1092 start_codon:yes stop_codon:yes gene_type:complete
MTRRYIRTNPALVDNIFNQDALNYFLRENLKEDFAGGSSINEDFIYQSLIGGPYQKGKKFNIAQRQTEQQLRFDVKTLQVSVPLYQEDFQVFNKGPLAAVKLLKSRIDEGYMSAGAFVSILTYLNGVNAGYTSNINGLAEALNDGSTASWDGNTYTTYGGLTRATYSPSLNSTPTAVSGSIQYDTVDQQYMNAFYGSGQYEPNLIVTTPIGFSYLKSKFQTQQRFQDTRLEVGVGFRGLSFNGATVVASRYCPGSYLTGPAGVGTADPVATTVLSEMSSPGGGAPSVTAYPVGSLGNSGESLWILNARKPFLNYYVSNDPTFGGGFRDFIPEAASTVVVGQVLLAHQVTLQPRYHRQLYGFSS